MSAAYRLIAASLCLAGVASAAEDFPYPSAAQGGFYMQDHVYAQFDEARAVYRKFLQEATAVPAE